MNLGRMSSPMQSNDFQAMFSRQTENELNTSEVIIFQPSTAMLLIQELRLGLKALSSNLELKISYKISFFPTPTRSLSRQTSIAVGMSSMAKRQSRFKMVSFSFQQVYTFMQGFCARRLGYVWQSETQPKQRKPFDSYLGTQQRLMHFQFSSNSRYFQRKQFLFGLNRQKTDFQTYLSVFFSLLYESTPSLSPQITIFRPVKSISLSNCCSRLPNPEIQMNLRQLSQYVRNIQCFQRPSTEIWVKKSMLGSGNAQSCYCPCQRQERVGYGQILMRLSLLFIVILANLTAFSPMTNYYTSLNSSPLLLISSLTIFPAFVPTTILQLFSWETIVSDYIRHLIFFDLFSYSPLLQTVKMLILQLVLPMTTKREKGLLSMWSGGAKSMKLASLSKLNSLMSFSSPLLLSSQYSMKPPISKIKSCLPSATQVAFIILPLILVSLQQFSLWMWRILEPVTCTIEPSHSLLTWRVVSDYYSLSQLEWTSMLLSKWQQEVFLLPKVNTMQEWCLSASDFLRHQAPTGFTKLMFRYSLTFSPYLSTERKPFLFPGDPPAMTIWLLVPFSMLRIFMSLIIRGPAMEPRMSSSLMCEYLVLRVSSSLALELRKRSSGRQTRLNRQLDNHLITCPSLLRLRRTGFSLGLPPGPSGISSRPEPRCIRWACFHPQPRGKAVRIH